MNISTLNRVAIALLLVGSLIFVALPVYAQESTIGVDEADQSQAEVMAEIEANKAAFAQELAARWEAEALARGNDESWLERVSGILSEEDAESLLSKSEAESYDGFIGLQTTSELVFTPLKPCRIVDTRFATRWGPFGTPIFSGGTINVRTYPSLAGQGGASNCGVLTSSAAVVINVTVVPVSGGSGFVTVWPFGQSRPTASLVNYSSSSVVNATANAVSQSQCRLCSNEINVYAFRTAHVIIDVIGYFANNTRTPLDNDVRYASSSILNNGNFNVYSPACISGFRLTGGGFLESNFDEGLNFVGSRPVKGLSSALVLGTNQADRYLCQGRNQSGGTRTVYCYSVCARIPGR